MSDPRCSKCRSLTAVADIRTAACDDDGARVRLRTQAFPGSSIKRHSSLGIALNNRTDGLRVSLPCRRFCEGAKLAPQLRELGNAVIDGGKIAVDHACNTRARFAAATAQGKNFAHLIERETDLFRAMDKAQDGHGLAGLGPIGVRKPLRDREPLPFIKAYCRRHMPILLAIAPIVIFSPMPLDLEPKFNVRDSATKTRRGDCRAVQQGTFSSYT